MKTITNSRRQPVATRLPSGRDFLVLALVACIYFVAARLSLHFVLQPEGIAVIWPPAGIFLASMLLIRRHLRPWLAGALFVTDLVAEMLAGTPLPVSIIYALALTGDAVLSSWLLLRFVGEPITFTRVRDVFGFLVLSVLFSNGLLSLVAASASMLLPGASFWNSWKWWLVSDGIGNLLVTPFLICWFALVKTGLSDLDLKRVIESALLFSALCFAGFMVFVHIPANAQFTALITYFIFPLLLWASLRFGLCGATAALLIVGGFAVRFALTGQGAVVSLHGLQLDSLILVQLYLAVMAPPLLFLAALVSEKKQNYGIMESEQNFLSVLLDNIKEAVVSCDAQGKLVRFNEAARQLHGLPEQDIPPEQWAVHYDLYKADGHTPLSMGEVPLYQALQGRIVSNAEIVVAPKRGNPRTLICNGRTLTNSRGETIGAVVAMHDITDSRQAQTGLQESEERLRMTIEVTHIGLWDWDMRKDVWYSTPIYFEMLGYDPTKEAQNREVWGERTHPDDREFVVNKMVEVRDGGLNGFDIEYRFRHADGSYRWINSIGQAVEFDETGKATRMLGLQIDITPRREIQEELRAINEELSTVNRIISTTTTTTTTTTGVQGILEKVLDEALAITGLEGGTICLVTEDDRLHLAGHSGTSEATIADLTTNIVKIGDCLCGECARDHKSLILHNREEVLKFATREATRGEDIRFHAAFPLLAGEKCLGVLCVFTRTDTKPAERSLTLLETVSSQIALAVENAQLYEKTLQYAATMEDKVKERTIIIAKNQKALMNVVEDLNEKSKALQAANVKLQELDQLKSMFIASMSHELRTPLNSIIGFTGIMLQGMTGDLNDEQRDQLERVYRSGKHLLSLITDIIDIAKIESGKITPYPEEFQLNALVDEAVGQVRKQAEDKGLAVEQDIRGKPVTMRTDRRRLLQCLLNFLSNAVKFTEKGVVTVEVHSGTEAEGTEAQRGGKALPEGWVEIRVSDTGIGIREEDMKLLFGSFVRLDSSLKMMTQGTGLGLYLTKKLAAEVLGGEVRAESEEGKGSTFSLRMPRVLEVTKL